MGAASISRAEHRRNPSFFADCLGLDFAGPGSSLPVLGCHRTSPGSSQTLGHTTPTANLSQWCPSTSFGSAVPEEGSVGEQSSSCSGDYPARKGVSSADGTVAPPDLVAQLKRVSACSFNLS